jgi:hypothetical protein
MLKSDFVSLARKQRPELSYMGDDEIVTQAKTANPSLSLEDEPTGIIGQAAQFAGNVAGGAISEIPKAAANIVSFAPNVLGRGLSALGAKDAGAALQYGASGIQSLGQSGKSSIEGGLSGAGYEKESIGSAIGGIGTDIAASFLIPGGPAMKGAGILKAGAAGAVDMAKFAAAERGDLPTLGEVAIGGAFGSGFKVAGKAIGAASQKLTLAGLMNPARLRAVNEALAKGGDDIVAKEGDLAGFLQNRGIVGSKEEIAAKLEQNAARAKAELDTAIGSVPGTFKSEGISSIIRSLRNATPTLEGVASPKASILDDLLDKSEKIGLNLQELNQTKRLIDDTVSIFKRSGEEAAGQKAAEWSIYRNQLKRDIEDIAKEHGIANIRQLNNEIAVSKTAAEAISGKLAADQARDLLSMFVIRPGGGAVLGAGSQLGSGDPWQMLKGAAFGAITGGLANTAVTSRAGYWLSKLAPAEKGALRAFLDSKGEAALPDALAGKIKNLAQSAQKEKPRLWDYERDVKKKVDIFGNVRYEGQKGPLIDSSKAKEAEAYFDHLAPEIGAEKAAAQTQREFGANNVKRKDIRKAAEKSIGSEDMVREPQFGEKGFAETLKPGYVKPAIKEEVGAEAVTSDAYDKAMEQFQQSGTYGKRPSAPSMGGETAEDIVRGWGSVPADVVQEYRGLSDRAKQYLLPYNPEKGVPLLPERATEMQRSVQAVQSRSKKIELPAGKPAKKKK